MNSPDSRPREPEPVSADVEALLAALKVGTLGDLRCLVRAGREYARLNGWTDRQLRELFS